MTGAEQWIDRYRVVRLLGEGGQGTVYLAEDPTGRPVAVKVLLPEVVADPVARNRIGAEVALARRVPSFCTARLLDARLDGERPYLVTEYIPGPSLAGQVLAHGPLAGSDLERLMVATLTALVTIHRAGVVHHDLKPANILLGPDGPRVVDFGIALRAGALDPQSGADGVLGSAAFLAPERLDAGPATPASDMFGWAATMVHAATGRSPFQAGTQAGVIEAVEHGAPRLDGVPGGLRPLLAACLEKDPARRPGAGVALAGLLESLQPVEPDAAAARVQAPGQAVASEGWASGGWAAGTPPWGTPDAARPTGYRPVRAPLVAPVVTRPAAGPSPAPGRYPAAPPPWPGPPARLPVYPAGRGWKRPVRWLVGALLVGGSWLGTVSGRVGTSQDEPLPAVPVVSAVSVVPAVPVVPVWAPTVAFDPLGVELLDRDGPALAIFSGTTGGSGDDVPVQHRSFAPLVAGGSDEEPVARLSPDGSRLAVLSAARQPGGGPAQRRANPRLQDTAPGAAGPVALTLTGPDTGEADLALSWDGAVVAASVGGSSPAASGGQVQGRVEGRVEGRATEARLLLHKVLTARAFPITQDVRARIDTESDVARLESWLEAAVTAGAIGDVFRDG